MVWLRCTNLCSCAGSLCACLSHQPATSDRSLPSPLCSVLFRKAGTAEGNGFAWPHQACLSVCVCVCICLSVSVCLCVGCFSLSLVSSRLVSCLSLLQSYVELCFNAQEMDSLKADVDAARTAQRTADQHVRVCVRVCVCVLKGAHNCQSLAVCFAWHQQPCPYAQCTYTPTHAHVLTHLYASPCPCRQWQWRGKTRR